MTALIATAAAVRADTPASSVYTSAVALGQSYPGVAANSEGWFDVGGFCKVVDVGDLSTIAPGAHGIPVFVPGPANQWENYRTSAPAHYNGQLILTTCCRPQANIATLCAGATNPQSVSLQYGRLNETDTVSGTCIPATGQPYTETIALTCQGDDGPDGQAAWSETSDTGNGPQCPAMSVTWEDDGNNDAICSGILPSTPAGTTGTAVQTASAANGWTNGHYNRVCNASGAWVADTSHKFTDIGYDAGTCQAVYCTAPITWTVGSYTCTANATIPSRAQPTETLTAYVANINVVDPATFVSGKAQATCNANNTWTIGPGATCGPGQCVPDGATTDGPCEPGGWQLQTDSCGNSSVVSCTSSTPPPPPSGGGTTSTECPSGTIMAECTVWPAYQCNAYVGGPLLPTVYSDCGGECQALGLADGAPNTWPDAYHTFTLPTCTCTTGTHGGCPAWTGQATCYICN